MKYWNRDSPSVAVALLLFVFIPASSHLAVFAKWEHGKSTSLPAALTWWAALLMLHLSTICMFVSYARAALTDPGKVDRNWSDALDDGPFAHLSPIKTVHFLHNGTRSVREPRICHHCSLLKPPRAHHCRHCGVCVLRMDHHCPWIGNCVGFHNQHHFARFLFYTTCSCLIATTMLFARIASLFNKDVIIGDPTDENKETVTFTELFFTGINLCLLVPITSILAMLFYNQVYYLATNMTTVEEIELKDRAFMTQPDPYETSDDDAGLPASDDEEAVPMVSDPSAKHYSSDEDNPPISRSSSLEARQAHRRTPPATRTTGTPPRAPRSSRPTTLSTTLRRRFPRFSRFLSRLAGLATSTPYLITLARFRRRQSNTRNHNHRTLPSLRTPFDLASSIDNVRTVLGDSILAALSPLSPVSSPLRGNGYHFIVLGLSAFGRKNRSKIRTAEASGAQDEDEVTQEWDWVVMTGANIGSLSAEQFASAGSWRGALPSGDVLPELPEQSERDRRGNPGYVFEM